MSDMDDKLRSAYARLPREEPRASLDAAILDASRRAVAPRRSSQRWAVPLSVAAVLVLTFGIAIHRDEYPTSFEESKMAAPQAERAPATDTGGAKPAEPPPMAQPAPKPAEPAKHDEAAKREPERARGEVAATRAKKTASAAALRDAAREEKQSLEMKPLAKDSGFAPEPQATAPPMQKETANMAAPAPAAPPARAATVTAPAPPAPAMSAAAPTPREADALRAQPRMKMEASRQAPAAAADVQAPDEITRELDAIAKLRAEHRDDEADKALEAFRRKHPDYRIPDAVWERVKAR